MVKVTTSVLLAAWEHGLAQSGSRRLLTLLATAYPELSQEQLLALPVGRRDGLALKLREALFGPRLTSIAACPLCTEKLELALAVADISVASEPCEPPLTLKPADFELTFRLPDSRDLLFIETAGSVDEARGLLFERCLLSAYRGGLPCGPDALPEEVLDQVEVAMSAADPQADVRLDLCCPACRHQWLATFDIASFLWGEINAWARRILHEVHLLARAYGWREADILVMTPTRRRLYLEKVTP